MRQSDSPHDRHFMSSVLLASELYAISQSNRCIGEERCHWCNAPCQRLWIHDEPPAVIGVKRDRLARNQNGVFICVGCWLWRRGSVTVNFLSHSDGNGLPNYKDRQKATNWSWLVTETQAWALRREDASELYSILLSPPLRFFLSLLDGDKPPPNHLQMCLANDLPSIGGDTKLQFTINNIPHAYTIYELEDVLTGGDLNGKESGVRALVNMMGVRQSDKEKRGVGRPPVSENKPSKIIKK